MGKLTTEVKLILNFLLAFFLLKAGPAAAEVYLRSSFHYWRPHPPRFGRELCFECGGELYQRDDDTVETMTNRLNVYVQSTRPLIEYYNAAGVYTKIDGRQPIEKVTEDLVKVLTSVQE